MPAFFSFYSLKVCPLSNTVDLTSPDLQWLKKQLTRSRKILNQSFYAQQRPVQIGTDEGCCSCVSHPFCLSFEQHAPIAVVEVTVCSHLSMLVPKDWVLSWGRLLWQPPGKSSIRRSCLGLIIVTLYSKSTSHPQSGSRHGHRCSGHFLLYIILSPKPSHGAVPLMFKVGFHFAY